MRRKLAVLAAVVGLALLAFLLLLLIAPFLLKDRIQATVLKQVNRSLRAEVAVESVDISLWSSFPDAELRLSGLSVQGEGPFKEVPLATMKGAVVVVDLMSAIGRGPIRITGLTLDTPVFRVLTLVDGTSNTDIAPTSAAASEGEAGPTPELWLRDVAISGLSLDYEDRTKNTKLVVEGLDLSGDAEVSGDEVALRATGKVAAVDLKSGGVELLKRARASTTLDLRYSPVSGNIHLGDSRIGLNELALTLAGDIHPGDEGTDLDLQFAAADTGIKGLLSLLPSAYAADFAGVKAGGQLGLTGSVKGLLPSEGGSLPAFDLAVTIAHGSFKYPDLPVGVDNIDLDLAVHHPIGISDLVEIDLPTFRLTLDHQPFKGRLSLRTPVSDPAIDTAFKGKLDLGRLSQAIPMNGGVTLTGLMETDLELKGKVSQFEAANVDAVTAAGTLRFTNVVWTDPAQPMPFEIDQLQLAVDPRRVDLADFKMRMGASDLSGKGQIDDAIGWALADHVLKGSFLVSSRNLDFRPFEGPPGREKAAPSGESKVAVIPSNLDLRLDLGLAHVQTNDYDLRKVHGQATVKDGVLRLLGLEADTLGGSVGIDGSYTAPSEEAADIDFNVTANNLDLAQTVATFASVGAVMPLLKTANGRIHSGVGLRAHLGRDLSPDYETLFSKGNLRTLGVTLRPTFMKPVAKFTGDSSLEVLQLDGNDLSFLVDGGKLNLDRMPFKAGKAKGTLEGKTGIISEALDLVLNLDLPTSAITGSEGKGQLAALTAGIATVGLAAEIGGTWADPKVKMRLSDSLQDSLMAKVDELKGEAVAQVNEALGKLVDEARARGDQLVAEAEKAADKLRAEGKAAGDKIRKEAKKQGDKLVSDAKGNPIKESAAKEAAKQLNKEADKKADKIEGEANKQADRGVQTAQNQRDKMIAEAEAKAKIKP